MILCSPQERETQREGDVMHAQDLTADDEFLVLGCDGIFELLTSQKAIEPAFSSSDWREIQTCPQHVLSTTCRRLLDTREQ